MEKKSIWPILRIILFLVQLFFQSLCTTLLLRLNIFPGKYVALFLGVMAVFALCTGLLVFLNVHGRIRLWRKITAGILALVIAFGCGVIFKLALDAQKLMQDFAGETFNARNTYVVVMHDNAAQSVKDTKDYCYGILQDYDVEHTRQMLTIVEQETGVETKLIHYGQASAMVNALYAGDADALVMNGVSISLLIEQPGFEDFLSRVRLLYTLPYQDGGIGNTGKDSVSDPFVVYISGSDTRNALLSASNSDVNILAVVNPKTKQILLLNTPRDYYIPNPAGKGALDKLTHCGSYGIDCSIEALEGLYDINVGYYGHINFVGFEKLIDAIGGITVYADRGFTAVSGDYFPKGENNLDGKLALTFARERYNLASGDYDRGKNQMKVISAVIDKMTSSKTLIANYSNILNSLEGMFATNFTTEEMSALVKLQMNDMSPWNVQSFAVSGTGAMEETYSWKGQPLSVTWPNEDTVRYAKTLINRVLDGETLTAEDMVMPK